MGVGGKAVKKRRAERRKVNSKGFTIVVSFQSMERMERKKEGHKMNDRGFGPSSFSRMIKMTDQKWSWLKINFFFILSNTLNVEIIHLDDSMMNAHSLENTFLVIISERSFISFP